MRGRCLLVFAVTATMLIGGAAAGAKVRDQARYSGTDEFTIGECAFPLDAVVTFEGHALLREHKDGQAFLVKDAFSYRVVVTNPDTEGWFVIRGHGVFHEIKATLVEGTVYEFVAIEAGQPFVIESSAGEVIVRDRGVIRHTLLFDTLGDGEPGGDFISVDSEVHGPHSGFSEDFPFCEIAGELTGVAAG